MMRNFDIRKFALKTGLILTSAALIAGTANAGDRTYSYIQSQASDGINIQLPGQSAVTRSIVLPFGKSTTVELPVPMMDVIVADPSVVEAMPHTQHRTVLIGRKVGQTNVYFYGSNNEEILTLEIRVERDLNGLKSLIAQHAEGAQVEVQAVNNNLLLTGRVPNAAVADKVAAIANMWLGENTGGGGDAGQIVNMMTVEGKDQVLLKVRMVEMQRSVSKQMGINLNAIGELGGGSTVSLLSNNALQTGAGLAGNFNLDLGGALDRITGAFDALERVGLIRTLAEPTLAAISGETANFLVGGEFPLLTNVFVDDQGRVQREFEFKPYGVALGFTPVVLSEGRISLNISTEVSEPTTEGSFETGGVSSDILGLRIRRANTVVELPAGGSLVIAGLIREEARQSVDGIPGAKDLPLVGAAFRSRDDLTTQTELVIIVTPYLVDPTHPDNLQTPLDSFVPSNDKDSILLGTINKVYGDAAKNVTGTSNTGTFGHIVD